MTAPRLLLFVMAVWRATHLLHAEGGPWDLLERLRRLAARVGAGRLFDCFLCLSLWVSLPFALMAASDWFDGACLWLGLSGGAVLAERATTSKFPPPAAWTEAPGSIPPPPANEDDL